MLRLQLLLGFSFILFAYAAWTCPKTTLGNGVDGVFPNQTDYNYTAGMNCVINIGVPNGFFVHVNFYLPSNENGINKTYIINDDTGTFFYYSNAKKNLPPKDLYSGTNVHVQLIAVSSGQFHMSWYFHPVVIPAPSISSFVSDDQGYLLDLSTLTKNSSVVLKSNSPVSIYRGLAAFNEPSLVDEYTVFMYSGEGNSRTYLGTLNTMYQKKMITLNTAPYMVTLYSVMVTLYSGDLRLRNALMFRTTSSIQNLNYEFYSASKGFEYSMIPYTPPSNFTVYMGKGSAATVWIPPNSMNCLKSVSSQASVDWLPGGYVPPSKPIASFSSVNDLAKVPLLLSGNLYTFAAKNGSAGVNFAACSYGTNVSSGDYGLYTSKNYRTPTANYISPTIVQMSVTRGTDVTLTAVDSYSYFSIDTYAVVDNQHVDNVKLTNGTTTTLHGATYFSIQYIPTNNSLDTGGFMRFEATTGSSHSSKLLLVFIAVSTWFA